MSNNLFGLWDHQEKGVNEIMNNWRQGVNRLCYQLSTGGGKSRIIRTIVDIYSNSGKTIYIFAHKKKLVNQLSEELNEIDIKHGIIMAGNPMLRYRVQVCSIQTYINRIEKLPEPEILIFDECHHVKSKSYMKVVNRYPGAKILGVSATPARSDNRPLKDVFQKMILGPEMKDLISSGVLSDYDYYGPSDIDTTGLHSRGGDYVKKEIADAVRKSKIFGSAIEHYKREGEGRPGIVCCVSIEHCKIVADEFRQAGFNALDISSELDDQEIERRIKLLKEKKIDLLVQCDLLSEGVDIKGAEVLIMLRPTQSIIIFLQQIGRVLRSAPGKKKGIILDHVGNWQRHGLPDDFREWSLGGKKKKKDQGPATLKRCPDCMRPVSVKVRACPYCGHLWKETEKAGTRIPEQKKGKLVNIRERNDIVLTIARNAKTFSQAVIIGKQNGADGRQVWYIWTKLLKNKIRGKV